MVVDDDPDVREFLALALEQHGFAVMTAANGCEAIEQLRKEPGIRLVLLDLMMPVMSGAEFLDVVGRDPGLARIPVVIVSAWRESDQLPAAGRPFVSKPIDLPRLLALAEEYCCSK